MKSFEVLKPGGRAAFIASGVKAPESPRTDVASLRPAVGRDRPHLVRIVELFEAGAVHAPRGMLEFWVDPESPYYRDLFGSGKKFIFYCAGGMRSALAAQSVHRMGLAPVAHMRGGYGAWVEAEGPTEEKEAKLPEKKAD